MGKRTTTASTAELTHACIDKTGKTALALFRQGSLQSNRKSEQKVSRAIKATF